MKCIACQKDAADVRPYQPVAMLSIPLSPGAPNGLLHSKTEGRAALCNSRRDTSQRFVVLEPLPLPVETGGAA